MSTLHVALLERSANIGLGVSSFVSVGNKADLNENEFLAYLKDDPQTDVILFYLEDLADELRAGGLDVRDHLSLRPT